MGEALSVTERVWLGLQSMGGCLGGPIVSQHLRGGVSLDIQLSQAREMVWVGQKE